ncbi:MAG: M20/M25/M40 family metallo-hydrolase [Candidatus Hodarchaeales archaeon]
MSIEEEYNKYINKNLQQNIESLLEFIRIPTVTAMGGDHSYKAISFLETTFRSLGFKTEVFQTKRAQPVFMASMNTNKEKTLLFYDHYDVQPAEPLELWHSPPFQPEIRDNRIFGRGVADNKGEIIVRLSAIKMLLDIKGELPVNVKFVIEGEEEVSSPHLADFVKIKQNFLKADGCIWEFGGKNIKGTQEIWAGVKGICYVQLRTKGPKKDLHSALGAIVQNPANHLVAALASLRDDKSDKILIKDYYENVIEPSEELDQEIAHIQKSFDEDKQKEVWGIKNFIMDLTGEELLRKYYLSPTCTICGIWSGWQGQGGKTVLPAVAHAKIDFRLVPNQTPEEVLEKLKKHFIENGFDIEIEWSEGYKPAYTPLNSPFAILIKTTMKEIYHHEPIIHPWSPGSGPMYLFAEHLPVFSVGVGNPESNAHSPNENIEIEDFKNGQKFIAKLLENMADKSYW